MKPYSVTLDESNPLWDKLMEANSTLQRQVGSGIGPAELLSEAVRDPNVQAALVDALDALAGDAQETVATILDRTADEAEQAAMKKVDEIREKAAELREAANNP